MKCSFRDKARLVASLCACALIVVMLLGNSVKVLRVVKSFCFGEIGFGRMKRRIERKLKSDDLWMKYELVNVYGLSMKAAGRKEINESVLMDNGMLTGSQGDFLGEVKKTNHYRELPAFSRYLKKMGAKFIFVAAPGKMDSRGELLPEGLIDLPDRQADDLLGALEKASVQTLDLRRQLSDDIAQVERYFYRTDHHWTAEGALEGFRIIMERLAEDDPSIDTAPANPDLWERNEKADWFLGSRGKRTGALCAGVDPLIWYTPGFKTDMTCVVPHHSWIFSGDFETANIRPTYLETRDLFKRNPYCIYIGGDYPYVKHLNPGAPNSKKVLILKDSFSLPLQAFMSTAFTEVEVIDPRYYTASGIAEFCLWNRPDIVLMVINPHAMNLAAYARLGVDTAPKYRAKGMKKKALLKDYDVEIDASAEENHCVELPVEIKPGKTYRFSFKGIATDGEAADGVSVAVCDETGENTLRQQIFDVKNSLPVGDRLWTFRIAPEEAEGVKCRLVVFAGIQGKTAGTRASCSGIRVSELR